MKGIIFFFAAFLNLLVFSSSYAQRDSTVYHGYKQKPIEPIKLAGPRVGFTYISPGPLSDSLQSRFGLNPTFTQFGWQFEKSYFDLNNGTAGLIEFVGLIGGLEQNKFIPSGSLLIGIRNAHGFEFGFGPNLSLSGASFVLALGHTIKRGDLNFPINLALVPSDKGVRFSLLFGFTAQRRNQ